MNTVLLTITAFTFYLLASALLFFRIRTAQTSDRTPSNGYLFPAGVAIFLHLLLLIKIGFNQNGLVSLNFASTATMLSWFVTLIALLLSIRIKIPALFLILFPLNTVTILGALLLPNEVAAATTQNLSSALITHIILSIFAYGILGIASLIAVLLAIQDFQLHHHQQGFLLKQLPPLQTLERLLFRLIETGFLLLTFSVFSGFLTTDDLFNHKIAFSIVAWVVFFILLLGRHIAGWRGQTAIRWTLAGIAALMLAILGTKIVFEFIVN